MQNNPTQTRKNKRQNKNRIGLWVDVTARHALKLSEISFILLPKVGKYINAFASDLQNWATAVSFSILAQFVAVYLRNEFVDNAGEILNFVCNIHITNYVDFSFKFDSSNFWITYHISEEILVNYMKSKSCFYFCPKNEK